MPAATPTYRSSPTFTGGRTFNRTASFARPLYYGRDDALKLFLDVGRTIGESPLSNVQVSALATLISSLKSAGIWDKFYAIYPIIGGTSGWHSLNLKSATNYRMVANGTIINNSNGTQGNGVNGYWDTGFAAASPTKSIMADGHVAAWPRTDVPEDSWDFGLSDAGSALLELQVDDGTSNSAAAWADNATQDLPPGTVLCVLNQLGVQDVELYANSVLLYTFPKGAVDTSVNTLHFMSDGGGTHLSTRQYMFFSYGKYLDSTNITDYGAAVTAFQTALGRAV